MAHEEGQGRDGSEAAGRGADVDEGVGRTALMVAAARAVEAGRPDALAPRHLRRALRTRVAYEMKHVEKPAADAADHPLHTVVRERIGVDLSALFNREPRPDSAAGLTARGWTTAIRTPFDFTRQYGRGPLPQNNDTLAANRRIFASAPAGH